MSKQKKQPRSKKLCFINQANGVLEKEFEFDYFGGFAIGQKQKCICSLHDEILKQYPNSNILEVSTKSPNKELGFQLSAFNLTLQGVCIEDIFQTAKVFVNSDGYCEGFDEIKERIFNDEIRLDAISNKTDKEKAKKIYQQLKASGFWDTKSKRDLNKLYLMLYPQSQLDYFDYKGKQYPNEPKTLFYDYIYIQALREHKIDLSKYNVFTDIEFGKNSINCQARSCALYNYLICNNELEHYLGVMENIETQDNKKEIEKFYEEVFIKSALM